MPELTSAEGQDTAGQLSDKHYLVRNKHSYHLKKKLAVDGRGRGFYGRMSATRTPYWRVVEANLL